MNKFMVYSLLFIVFSVTGCTMRADSYKMDRVDQELKGNRGYIMGTVPSLPETKKKTTRTMYNIEVELPSLSDFEKPEKTKKAATVTAEPEIKAGNRGYVQSKAKVSTVKEEETVTASKPVQTPQVICQRVDEKVEESEKPTKIYVVKKGDTLQKISNKLFGTTKRWKRIYEANKNLLKGPDKIKPGQKLVIPMD